MTIKYENIYKCYKNQEVLKGLNLSIPNGSIFFLLGLNGAGKTTLMKMALGLVSPDKGQLEFKTNEDDCSIGALIETPTFYNNMTAYENLKHYAILTGASHTDIISALDLVGLDWKNKKKVKKYSLGMCQRLGLARAILANPKFLILDEPFNGLDPIGIEDVKKLIVKLNVEKGITVFLSSHLIRETENLATHYAIINDGRIVLQFSSGEIDKVTKCIYIKQLSNKHDFFNCFKQMLQKFILIEKENSLTIINKSSIAHNDELQELYEKIGTSKYISEPPEIQNISLNELFYSYTRGKNNGFYN